MLKILKLILLYFAYQMGFSAIALVIANYISIDTIMMTSLTMVASTLAMTWHLIHFGYVSMARDKYKTIDMAAWGVSVIFVIAATYVLNVIIEQLGVPNTMEETFIGMSRNPFGMLSIALLAPILEELLFRGAIEGQLLRTVRNPWVAIVVSSAIFGVVHLNPAQIPFAFLIGMMFGWLYYRTGSLLPGIVGHVLNNTIAAINLQLYGGIPIEEQVSSTSMMWLWVVVATIAFVVAAAWLNRYLNVNKVLKEYNKNEE